MSKKYDVALLGYYGFKNLGDELLLESIVAILKESGVDSEQMAVLSSSPEETITGLLLGWRLCMGSKSGRWDNLSDPLVQHWDAG